MPPPDTPGAETLLEHFDWTRRLARALVHEPHRADDLAQDTWLSFLRSPPPAGRPVRPWLRRVMRNTVRERARRDRARADHEGRAARGEGAPSDTDLAERMDLHRKLVEHVMALEPLYRRAILLRFFEGLSATEIARRDGVPQATVRTRLRRGIEQLRESLERKGRGDWRLAMLPLLPKVGSAAPTGVLIVGTKSMLAVVAGLATLVLGIVWWGGGGERTDLSTAVESGGQASLDTVGGRVGESGGGSAAVTPLSSEVQEGAREEVAESETSGRVRRVRVVRDEDGVRLPGAEVRFVRHTEFVEWRRKHALGGRSDALPCIQALGESHTADEAGVVLLPIADEMACVSGTLGDYFTVQTLHPGDETAELRLVLAPPLRVLVVDPQGSPVSGASVGLFEFLPGAPSRTLVRETFTDPSGIASLHPLKKHIAGDAHYRVGLYFPLASPVEVQVAPLQPPAEPIRLVAPPTGSVRVVLVGDDEEPWPKQVDISLYAIVPSRTERERMVRSDQRDHRRLTGVRELVFPHVAVGLDVHLYVYGVGTRKDVALNHPGPRAQGEQVVIRIPFTERYAWIEGRFVREDGGEVPNSLDLLALDLDSDTSRIDRGMTVDPDGSFRIVLTDRVPAGARCWMSIQTDNLLVPSLSVSFEIIAPVPGTGTRVGRVVLHEAPLIVGGTVTNVDGEPLELAHLSLGDQLHQPDGSFDWNLTGFARGYTDDEGRFEIRGEVLPDAYALHAGARDHETSWIPFELGQSDLRIVLAHRGGLVGQLRLPSSFSVERLAIVARPASDEPPDWWRNSNRSVGVTQDGGFEIPDLNPGAYEIGVLTGRYSEPLAVLGEVEISRGEEHAPEFLADVDLTRLKVLDIQVVPPAGGSVEGLIGIGAEAGLRRFRIQDGLVSIVTAQVSLEVTVLVEGYRPVHIPDLRESTIVDLESGIPVVVTLPAGFTLPDAPLFLDVALIPDGWERPRNNLYVYSRDSADRKRVNSHEFHPSRRFDGGQEVVLTAPGPGRYELMWWVLRPFEVGFGGGGGRGVRWKERYETFQVEDAAVHLIAQPLQAAYEEALKRMEEGE